MGIGKQDLYFGLQMGRLFAVGSGVSTTSIPAQGATLVAGAWAGAQIYWLAGSKNAGTYTPVTGNTSSALTVATMSTAAVAGDPFVLLGADSLLSIGGQPIPTDGGAAPTGVPFVLIGGYDGTDVWALRLDSNHYLQQTIAGASILSPTDMQSIYRPQVVLTTTALAVSGTFTSSGINAIANPGGARRITGKVYANVAGSLAINQSDDDSTWDTLNTIAVAASTPQGFDVECYAAYVELVYTNGSTAQTTFRLSAYLAPN